MPLRACCWVDDPGGVYHERRSLPTHSRTHEKLDGSGLEPARVGKPPFPLPTVYGQDSLERSRTGSTDGRAAEPSLDTPDMEA